MRWALGIWLVLSSGLPLLAQNGFFKNIRFDHAAQYLGLALTEQRFGDGGTFRPTLVAAHVEWRWGAYRGDRRSYFFLAAEPQVNANEFLAPGEQRIPESEYEIGANGIIGWRYTWHEKLRWKLSVGSGPHYLSRMYKRQARGYIFSDNFTGGFDVRLGRQWLTFLYRFRHLSNAGLQRPNGGLNNHLLVFGFRFASAED